MQDPTLYRIMGVVKNLDIGQFIITKNNILLFRKTMSLNHLTSISDASSGAFNIGCQSLRINEVFIDGVDSVAGSVLTSNGAGVATFQEVIPETEASYGYMIGLAGGSNIVPEPAPGVTASATDNYGATEQSLPVEYYEKIDQTLPPNTESIGLKILQPGRYHIWGNLRIASSAAENQLTALPFIDGAQDANMFGTTTRSTLAIGLGQTSMQFDTCLDLIADDSLVIGVRQAVASTLTNNGWELNIKKIL